MKRILYDDNPKLPFLLSKSKYPWLLGDMGVIMKDYTLFALIKLHDPAVNRGNNNLSIEYIIQNGKWNKRTRVRLEKLKNNLDKIAQPLKIARNKILAHRDVKTIEAEKPLGGFGKLRSTRYFNLLQRFVNIVSKNTGGGIYPLDVVQPLSDAVTFKNLIVNDTEEFHIMGWIEEYAKTKAELPRLREKWHEAYLKKEEYENAKKELIKITIKNELQRS
jgi:hypothetical protein